MWCPEAAPLAALRRDVDERPQRIRRALLRPGLRKEFLGGVPEDEKRAVRAFCAQNAEKALKTKPKGYEADNENIEILRLKNYTVGRRLADEEVLGAQGLRRMVELMGCLVPWVTYLNRVVMPDEEDDGDSEGEDEEGDK